MTNNIYIACSPQIEKTQKRWQHAFSVCSQMEKVERCHRPFPSLNPTQTHCGGDDHAAQCGTPSSSPCEPQERGKGERARGRKGVMQRLRGQRCRSERVGGVEGISANSNDARSRSSRKRMGWEKEKLGSAWATTSQIGSVFTFQTHGCISPSLAVLVHSFRNTCLEPFSHSFLHNHHSLLKLFQCPSFINKSLWLQKNRTTQNECWALMTRLQIDARLKWNKEMKRRHARSSGRLSFVEVVVVSGCVLLCVCICLKETQWQKESVSAGECVTIAEMNSQVELCALRCSSFSDAKCCRELKSSYWFFFFF